MTLLLLAALVCPCTVPAPVNSGAADSVISCVGELGPIVVTRTYVSWGDGAASSSTRWDVIRGIVGDWPSDRGTCLPVTIPWYVASSDPLPGVGFWFLVRGRNICGVGTYGHSSNGIERLNNACP